MKEPNLLKKDNTVNNQRKYLIMAVMMVVTLFVGTSYALLTNFDKSENVISIKTGNMSMTVNDAVLTLNSEIPKSDEEGLSSTNSPVTLTFTNNGNVNIMKYEVNLVSEKDANDNITSTLDYSYIKYGISLNQTDYDIVGKLSDNGNLIFTGVDLAPTKSKTIYLKLWIDEAAGNNVLGKQFNGSLDIHLFQKSEFKQNKIIDYITDNNIEKVQFDTNIKFYEVNGTTNGNGLFMRNTTAGDTNPVYYFRGNVNNNNLLFANACWKIVRTTEGGGTKLIYNGLYDETNKCNNTGANTAIGSTSFQDTDKYNSLAYVGYVYGDVYESHQGSKTGTYGNSVTYANGVYTLVNTNATLDDTHHYVCEDASNCTSVRYYYYSDTTNGDYYITLTGGDTVETALKKMLSESTDTNKSNIQNTINTWYDGSIKNTYGSYVEDTTWCMNRRISTTNLGGWNPNGGSLSSNLIFDTSKRIQNADEIYPPVLTCSNSNDRLTYSTGTGKIASLATLLTTDEVVLSGIISGNTNNNNYLYVANNHYWLLSPGNITSLDAGVMSVGNGSLSASTVTSSNLVRPALSLNSSVEIQSGTGLATDPLVVTPYSGS